MIFINNLTKIYKSKKGYPCLALDNVSFTLPDKGMIFILGKSGSGKSTLLNLLGGLDTITSGDIIVDGNKFSSFKEKDYENYRNSHVGFVFQDFCLIESLSVKENVELSLRLQGASDDEKLKEILSDLDLTSLENRIPAELSGGQRQRVAIARAMLKSPKLILADEPTGNLDSLSAQQVLTSLKKISATNLVIVVSHNPDDAEKYGDRIIEIADGKIINDIERKKNAISEVLFTENEIILPDKKRLNENEIDKINAIIKERKVSIKQAPALFEKAENAPCPPSTNSSNAPTRASKMKLNTTLNFSFKFLVRKLPSFIFSIIMVSVVIVMFGLCQLISMFDENSALNNAIQDSKDDVFIMQKAYEKNTMFNEIKTDGFIRITDEDVQSFKDAGYEGNIYKLYNYNLTPGKVTYHHETQEPCPVEDNYAKFYAIEDVGVLVCDEEFLIKKFGKNGKLDYLAVAQNQKEGGLIITDYVADALMLYTVDRQLDYSRIVGSKLNQRGYVNAIINTGYKEKYAHILHKFKEYSSSYSPENRLALIELAHEEEYVAMLEDFNSFINVSYSFNPNFVSETNSVEYREFTRIMNGDLYTEDGTFYYIKYMDCLYGTLINKELAPGEIIFPIKEYNEIFGTNLMTADDPNFQEKTITIRAYPRHGSRENNMLYEITLKIVGIEEKAHAFLNSQSLEYIRSFEIYPYALYFDDTSDVISINSTGEENLFVANSGAFKAISSVSEIVVVFKDLFLLIAICICIAGMMILLSFGLSNVKKRNFEIGVIRALGGTIKDISLIFIIQMLVAGAVICLISSLGLFFAVEGANAILGESFMVLMNSSSLKHLEIISFNPIVLVVDLVILIAITLISAFLPIIAIRRVKPLEIIRKKD